MASSLSSKYLQEQRDKLFHNKYKYRVKFTMSGAGRTYWHRTLQTYEQSIADSKRDYGKRWSADPYEPKEIDAYMKFKRKYLSPNTSKYRTNVSKFDSITITTHGTSITIFANDEQVIKDVNSLGFGNPVTTEAVVSIPRGTMYFKRKPEYTHRIYLKSKKANDEFKESMTKFLDQYDGVKACGALKHWLKDVAVRPWMRNWIGNGYFIDFNGEQYYTLMLLYFDDKYLGKFYELHQQE
jgi:hypothetical protein